MDWPRAKNILIVAFTAINLLLGYWIWLEPRPVRLLASVTSDDIRDTKEALTSANLVLAAAIPRRYPAMPFLVLGPGESGTVRYPDQGGQGPRPVKLDEETARRIAEAFLARNGGLPADARYDHVLLDPSGERAIVTYVQEYQGYPIYGTRLAISLSGSEVRTVDRFWVTPAGYRGGSRAVIPPTDALQRVALLEGRSTDKRVIESLTIGYYTRAYDAAQWEAVPVWRIRLSNGRSYQFNGYTGAPER